MAAPGWQAEQDIVAQADTLPLALAVNVAALATAQRLLADCSVVRLFAIGSSRHAAGFGADAIEVFAGKSATVPAAPGAAVPMPQLAPDHLVIVLSQSGETPALLEVTAMARARGCSVVAVTNAPDSTLAGLATVTLDCASGPESVVAATKSLTAQCLLLRGLAAPLGPAETQAWFSAVRDTLHNVQLARALEAEVPRHVICGGFAAGWIADEIALKFAEMAGRLVTAEPLVEHLHGPAAVEATTLAFLDPADPNARLLRPGAETTRVGRDPGYDVVIPHVGELSLDALISLIAGQRLVLAWSRELGEDADSSRGLSKVTRTA